MRHYYGEFDGQEFPTPDSLFASDDFLEFILSFGEKGLEALDKYQPVDPKLLEELFKQGMLEKAGGRTRLTPRAISAMQNKALMEIFAQLPRGTREGHATRQAGAGADRLEGTRPYSFGDPVSEIDLHQSLRNALQRRVASGQSGGTPIEFKQDDLELHLVEQTTSCALCILIDMSGSMMRYGRFLAAKKVALALSALVKQRFPQDSVDFVGFYSTATAVREEHVPLLMPKTVSTHEYSIDIKVPLAQAAKTHQHFTNLQLGMQMARAALQRRSAQQKLMFIITDGQPTAHVEGDTLRLMYPPSQRTALATLRDALMGARAGIRVATCALIDDYWGMDWVEFVDQLTRLCRGAAFYCASEDLSSCIMESYLTGRKAKTYIA